MRQHFLFFAGRGCSAKNQFECVEGNCVPYSGTCKLASSAACQDGSSNPGVCGEGNALHLVWIGHIGTHNGWNYNEYAINLRRVQIGQLSISVNSACRIEPLEVQDAQQSSPLNGWDSVVLLLFERNSKLFLQYSDLFNQDSVTVRWMSWPVRGTTQETATSSASHQEVPRVLHSCDIKNVRR